MLFDPYHLKSELSANIDDHGKIPIVVPNLDNNTQSQNNSGPFLGMPILDNGLLAIRPTRMLDVTRLPCTVSFLLLFC